MKQTSRLIHQEETMTKTPSLVFVFLILALSCCRCDAAEDRESDNHAARTAVNGLRCSLAADRESVTMGDMVKFTLRLRFDPAGVDPNSALLNVSPRDWLVTYTFTDAATGKVFR